ncbi:MAG TPA: S8 family peptidase [Bryobacteraceae bacterium]
MPADPPETPESPSTPDQARQEARRESTAEESRLAREDQLKKTEDVRLDMMRSIVTEPLLSRVASAMREDPERQFEVIIALNETFRGGIEGAMHWIKERAKDWNVTGYQTVSHYVFATIPARRIMDLAAEARELTKKYGKTGTLVYRIWEDTEVSTTLTHSLTTVKADAAQRAFRALGDGVVWAVLDSGIKGDHPHFKGTHPLYGPFDTLDITSPLAHRDFTPDGRVSNPPDSGDPGQPLATHATARMDRFGHGSHVAGIIAGFWQSAKPDGEPVVGSELRDETTDQPIPQRESLREISGVAPRAKLVSLKVIADVTRSDQVKQTAGQGKVSWILVAIDQIQQWNQNGKRQLIHGVNMSLGYDFDPRWFACGQSPLCVEVNRLVRNGVCVVVSAGNGGYTAYVNPAGQVLSQYTSLSITDPGNADLAITVGSTHREMPHTYGVSYFSSRGPTGDGRLKPDLLAPGERIISCAAGREIPKYPVKDEQGADLGEVLYCEQTGTSMAAPHVSGAVAAFLSVRSEFKGEPEKVKEIFLANAIDLHRESCFQGAGLLDLMKVLQAV